MPVLNAANRERPHRGAENRVRVSLGALAGVEGEIVGSDGDRLVLAVLASNDPARIVPGMYIYLPRENVEATTNQ